MNTKLLESLGFEINCKEWQRDFDTNTSHGVIIVHDKNGEEMIYIYSGLGMDFDYGFETKFSEDKLRTLVEVLGTPC